MATVTLHDVWLHDHDDFSDFVRLEIAAGMPEPTLEDPGEVHTYASGRRRRVRQLGRFRTIPVGCYLDEGSSELEWLRDMTGRDLMYRDFRGLLLFGSYGRLEETPLRARVVRVRFDLEETTGTAEA